MNQWAVSESKRSHAPKSSALPDDVKRVDVIAVGRARIIPPAGESWDGGCEKGNVDAVFMSDGEPSLAQQREGHV